MDTWGAKCVASPSTETNAGQKILAENPDSPGSLGIAISEAVEGRRRPTRHQVLPGERVEPRHAAPDGHRLETKKQLALAGDYPDVVIGCVGGAAISPASASRLSGTNSTARRCDSLPSNPRPARPDRGPSLRLGDTVNSPPSSMHTLGHTFVPPGSTPAACDTTATALGLPARQQQGRRGPGLPPKPGLRSGQPLRQDRGHHPRPGDRPRHQCAVDEAVRCRETKRQCSLFNLSGHGHFDLAAYDAYLEGKLEDLEYPPEVLARALAGLPKVQGA